MSLKVDALPSMQEAWGSISTTSYNKTAVEKPGGSVSRTRNWEGGNANPRIIGKLLHCWAN